MRNHKENCDQPTKYIAYDVCISTQKVVSSDANCNAWLAKFVLGDLQTTKRKNDEPIPKGQQGTQKEKQFAQDKQEPN